MEYGAADGYEAMAFDADVGNDIAMGFAPMIAMKRAMQKMRARRQARQGGGDGGGGPFPGGGGPFPGGGGAELMHPPQRMFRRQEEPDDDDAGDDDDLGADEAEIEDLGADDEGTGGNDDDLGAEVDEVGGIGDRIEKLKGKRMELKAKLAATPSWKGRKRRRLERHLGRIDRHIARKTARRDRKVAKVAKKLGVAPAAIIAAGGAGAGAAAIAAATGRSPGDVSAVLTESKRREQIAARGGARDVYNDSPPAARNVPIPLLFGGLSVFSTVVAAGVGLRTIAWLGATPAISFARFKVTGMKFDLSVSGAAGEVHVNALIDAFIVNGGINLLYAGGTNLRSYAQASGDRSSTGGTTSYAGVIGGLRDAPILDRTNIATANGTLRQEVTTAAAVNITLQLALVGDVLDDSNVRALT